MNITIEDLAEALEPLRCSRGSYIVPCDMCGDLRSEEWSEWLYIGDRDERFCGDFCRSAWKEFNWEEIEENG